ncbi:hypothetical protein FRC08_003075 [Ceratobasidium sp. 394]|nr:hypothetical protein FRC08_003075 [Ceratobasidium sp. 394]
MMLEFLQGESFRLTIEKSSRMTLLIYPRFLSLPGHLLTFSSSVHTDPFKSCRLTPSRQLTSRVLPTRYAWGLCHREVHIGSRPHTCVQWKTNESSSTLVCSSHVQPSTICEIIYTP